MKIAILFLLLPALGYSQYSLNANISNKSASVELVTIHTNWGFGIGYNAFLRAYCNDKYKGRFVDVSPIFTPSIQKKTFGIYFPTGYNFYGAEIRNKYLIVGWNNWVGIKIGYSLKFKI